MFKNYNSLGFNNPYYFIEEGKFAIHQNFSKAMKSYHGEKNIDATAALEMLNKEFIFGDRTVIENVNKTPWLAKPNTNLDAWEYDLAPEHGKEDLDEEEIAKILFKKICNEIELYIGDKKNIGILLSGGMDSRMVAGALDYLMKKGIINDLKVTAVTWGNSNTRDVIYAKRIADMLNWSWKHYPVTGKDLLNNIKETAIYGCEYSPIHLHAVPQIRDDNDFEVILAGSYGDSIGRAEYGGKKVSFLEPLINNIHNVGFLFREKIYQKSLKRAKEDIESYHKLFPRKEAYMQNELDYQLHYMRRMLNPCMDLFNEKMEFYQVFSHPDVYGFMWSLSPQKRNDQVYKHLLKEFVTNLGEVPWARTGLPYGVKEGITDNHLVRHHTYVQIIQHEILDDIKDSVLTEDFKKLGIFRYKSIEILFKLIKQFPINSLYYLEKVTWLASLAEMTRLYNIKGKEVVTGFAFNEYEVIYEYMQRYIRNRTGAYLRKFKMIK